MNSKTIWTLVIIVVVLVVLYLVYKYMFVPKQQSNLTLNTNTISIPRVKPAPSAVISDTTNSDNATKLMKMINCLGYQVEPIKSDGGVSAFTTNKTLDAFVKQFPKAEVLSNINNVIVSNVVTITSNGVTYKLDKEKYLELHSLGLQNITYNNKNESQITSIINKMNSFWGSAYFNGCLGFSTPITSSTERAIVEAIENSKPTVDCNSSEYQDKLTRLNADFKGYLNSYNLAVFNINNVDNAENTQALNRTSKNLKEADIKLKQHIDLCKK